MATREDRAMKLLLIHASKFWWHIRGVARGLKIRDEPEPEEADFEDVIVVFTAVERGDTEARAHALHKAVDAILEFSKRVKCSSIVLYPYAHLTTELAGPGEALELLRELEDALRGCGLNVTRAPFGYYKEFLLHCKGHPLSEAFRDIRTNTNARCDPQGG